MHVKIYSLYLCWKNLYTLRKIATFRFELDHKPTRNKTYNLYLMVTAAGKRTKKKTGIQLKRIDVLKSGNRIKRVGDLKSGTWEVFE